MKTIFRHDSAADAAFTMVEIAIALAVIAFALVAIIGVLPTGMNVQKENREETIINQDASVFMDAIRGGARGLDDLTNYVISITNIVQRFNVSQFETNAFGPRTNNWYTYNNAFVNGANNSFQRLTNGARIIGLLSIPKYVPDGTGGFNSNYVVANFRALSGAAADKFPQTNANLLNLSLVYRLFPEVSPMATAETNLLYMNTFETNLHEIRLAFRWPVLPNGSIGNARQTFRTLAGGRVVITNDNGNSPTLYFLQPSTFSSASEY